MSPMYDSVRWGVSVSGTLILSHRHGDVGWPVPFLAAFNFPCVATRYPFAAGWTVDEHPNYDLRVQLEPAMFCSTIKRSNHLATRPYEIMIGMVNALVRWVRRMPSFKHLSQQVIVYSLARIKLRRFSKRRGCSFRRESDRKLNFGLDWQYLLSYVTCFHRNLLFTFVVRRIPNCTLAELQVLFHFNSLLILKIFYMVAPPVSETDFQVMVDKAEPSNNSTIHVNI